MTIPNFSRLCQRLACAVVPLVAVWTPVADAQVPAQLPLLSRAGAGVQPNLMLLMDDSGSMGFRHMPETVFASDTFITTNPVQSNGIGWELTDTYQRVNFQGTVPGIQVPPNYVLPALRSPDTNTIYYNPEIRYQPWFNDDGVTRRPNAPVTTAYLNPPLKALTATSTTSNAIAIGSKTFTLAQTGKGFSTGKNVVISSTASPTTQWMYGDITSFNAGTGVIKVNVTDAGGTGTLAGWTFVQSPMVDLTQISPNGTFTPGSFVVGATYTIVTKGGSPKFNLSGAANNNVGTVFTATNVGSGTGTASAGTMAGGSGGWCFANTGISGTGTGSGRGCEAPTAAFLHDPGLYFRLQKTGTAYKNLTVIGNYTPYSINSGATAYAKVADRTDCSGAVGPTGCSKAEEQQNFANWFSYYRDRNLLARGSLMEAFAPDAAAVTAGSFVTNARYRILTSGTTSFTSIGAASNTVGTVFAATGAGTGTGTAVPITFRMGFGRINRGNTTVDGLATKAIESDAAYVTGGVRDYTDTRRTNLFQWLEDLPASGSTKLLPAFEAIGDYYKRTDAKGPWTDNPGGSNVVANNKTCRRSYQIAMTDGYWNTTAGSKGNADATATAAITGVGTTYPGYTPGTPYKDNTANTMADSAMYYWVTDLQPSTDNAVKPVGKNISFWQNMTTFTIGLGVRGSLDPTKDLPALIAGTKVWPPAGTSQTVNNVDDLWHAAVNSRGEYFSAKDPKELADSIKSILATATGDDKPTAGVATASTTLTTSNYKYVPEFQQQGWSGDVKAYRLNGILADANVVWSAAAKLPTPWSTRNIVTWDTGLGTPAAVPFDWSALSGSNQSALGSVAAINTGWFTDFLRGDHSQEGSGNPFRERFDKTNAPFILGDFLNSNPVAVLDSFNGLYGNLNLGVAATSNPTYPEFMAVKRARTSVLFAGANDGMLHGFKDSRLTPAASDDGREVFAYVPRAVYPNLEKLTDKTYGSSALPHQYFVDGPLREADAYVKAPGAGSASWRNYLVGTLGAGGRAVYGLDVTDLAGLGTNTVRWEISDTTSGVGADMGYILAPVKIGVLDNGRWVAIFGNGFSSTNGNATLFVVDLEKAADNDSTAVQTLNVGASGGNGLGGVTLIHDGDGKITTIYAGDLKGQMWKFAYNASATSKFEVSGGTAMFSATDGGGSAQPITSSPVVYNHLQGGRIVIFGTGKLFETADALTTSVQTVYAVWDKPADTFSRPMVRSNLTGRTLASFMGTGLASSTKFFTITDLAAINWTTSRGWRMDLGSALPAGRVIYPALVVGYDTALISAVAPAQGVLGVCDSLTGAGINLLLPVQSGLNPTTKTFDTNGDGVANGDAYTGDAYSIGYATAADGVDVVVRSAPVGGGGDSVSDGLSDAGGGGREGDCTGASCSTGGECVPSPLCEAGTCLSTVQSATAGMTICVPTGAPPSRKMDRVWRRIINPPIK